jgi:2-polyprenyl-3-methyl-5-hydroxy-6-metoxy-1,4-benzoquinol methylase
MNDVLGRAIADHFAGVRGGRLWVHIRSAATDNREFPREEMPVKLYFRSPDDMPELEWIALQHCRGRILDIGAGAGSHSMALQRLGLEVTALEISPLAAGVIKARGVRQVICQDFFTLTGDNQYDTLLLMMNGIGIAGNLDRLRAFLRKARALSRPGAALLFDSSDISYLYDKIPPPPAYYGELLYQYEYRRQLSDWFPWIFIDHETLARVAAAEGWKMELLFEDDKNQFLVKCW